MDLKKEYSIFDTCTNKFIERMQNKIVKHAYISIYVKCD